MASKNEKLLKAISSIFDSTGEDNTVTLSPEQTVVLLMSEQDIKHGRLVSAEDLNQSDLDWLK